MESQLKEFGIYDGESRELCDSWFYNTVLRDAGYFRNPKWGLTRKEQVDYVTTVITAEYNQKRAETAWTKSKKTQLIKKRILDKDAKGLMRDIRYNAFRENCYSFYYRSVRRLIKK